MKRYSGLPVGSGGLALSAYFIRSVPPCGGGLNNGRPDIEDPMGGESHQQDPNEQEVRLVARRGARLVLDDADGLGERRVYTQMSRIQQDGIRRAHQWRGFT